MSPEEFSTFWKVSLFHLALGLWAIKSLLYDPFEKAMFTVALAGLVVIMSRTVIASLQAGAKIRARRREQAEAAARLAKEREAAVQRMLQAQAEASAKYFDLES